MGYYVVIDLEMCKVPKHKKTAVYSWSQETIQIGAVLLNEKFEIVDGFSTFVSPEFGYIDSEIGRLTGISNKDVLGAPEMPEALKVFTDWIPEGDVRMVSWSMSDASQLRHELTGKCIENRRMEELLEQWTDCQAVFSERLSNNRRHNLEEALIIADIRQEGELHDGLWDAFNTALLFAKLETEPELKLNDFFAEARKEEVEHLSSSLAGLFSTLDLQFAS
ncbi:MAG: exonuclease domain-containing protein [Lachnospiraceae bacterium]|nr:exonuclease domain-containing protein [Lachnospiraceae bacterium]